MAYTTSGLIEAWDYNRLTWGGNTQAYSGATNNLAAVWGTGNGPRGYGQDATAMTTVSAGGTVTATQWSTFLQRLNFTLAHQSGAAARLASGSNIGVTAGATIQAFANANIAVQTVTTNANLWSAQGSTTVGTPIYQSLSVADFATLTSVWNRTITFSSGDAARYFFNAGGQINWAFVAYNLNGTARSGTVVTLFQTNLGGGNIRGVNGTAITGAGGTVTTNSGKGYWQLTSSLQLVASINSTTATYTGDVANINIRTNGTVGSNGDVGNVITLQIGYTSPQEGLNFNSAVSANVGVRFDIIPPSTTYLNNSWGSITFA